MSHLTEEPAPQRPTGSRRSITEEERQRFVEALDRTIAVSEAAKAIGISISSAYKLARTCGWALPNTPKSETRGKKKTKYTQEQKDMFFQAFARLQNVSAAAREVGFPLFTCFQWVKKTGLNTAPKRGQKRAEFLKLRAEGKSRSEATEIVGVHPHTGAE